MTSPKAVWVHLLNQQPNRVNVLNQDARIPREGAQRTERPRAERVTPFNKRACPCLCDRQREVSLIAVSLPGTADRFPEQNMNRALHVQKVDEKLRPN